VSTSRLLTSRRTAIALAFATPLTLAACELDPPSATPPDAPTPGPVPDAEVVASARKAILLMVASVEAAVATHLRLGPELGPWLALHAVHLDVLDDGAADASEAEGIAAEIPAPRAAIARERLLAQEAVLADSLAENALQAASGDLARALGSISAALRQRVVA